jgi:uncharacterized protein (DUF697 family)
VGAPSAGEVVLVPFPFSDLSQSTLIRVEVIGKLPKAFASEPKVGDLLP